MIKNFKVFVVNLDKDKERLKNIIIELKKQKLKNYEIIKAVEGDKFTDTRINFLVSKNKNFLNPSNTKMSRSEIGCALSHIKIYKKILKTNLDYALILEDDAVFLNDFSENLEKFILKNIKYMYQN